jgi:hypothetical protein
MNQPAADEKARRKRLIWLLAIANLTLVFLLVVLSFQPGISIQFIIPAGVTTPAGD